MDGGRRQTGRMTARLVACCAVLLGLFLMHGAPSAAADSCHAMAAQGVPAAAVSAQDGPARGATLPDAAAMNGFMPRHDHAAISAPGAAGERAAFGAPTDRTADTGASCLSTPARDRPSLSAAGLAVMAFLLITPGGATASGGSRERVRHGPSISGRTLLTRECVART